MTNCFVEGKLTRGCCTRGGPHRCHVRRHRPHRDGCFHSARDCIHATGQPEEVESLSLLPDGVSSVDACALVIALLQRLLNDGSALCGRVRVDMAHLLEACLLCVLILLSLLRLSRQSLCSELLAGTLARYRRHGKACDPTLS